VIYVVKLFLIVENGEDVVAADKNFVVIATIK
jgi:hypothetical protein